MKQSPSKPAHLSPGVVSMKHPVSEWSFPSFGRPKGGIYGVSKLWRKREDIKKPIVVSDIDERELHKRCVSNHPCQNGREQKITEKKRTENLFFTPR